MPILYHIKIDEVLLRPLEMSDAPSFAKHANNRKIWLYVRDQFPHPYSLEDAQHFISMSMRYEIPRQLAIVVDGEAVGACGLLLQADVYRKNAEIGYWVGEEYWGKGIATKAITALKSHAFTYFDLNRLYAGVFETNPASMRVLEKAGFEREGVSRKAVFKDGRFLDEVRYGVLNKLVI